MRFPVQIIVFSLLLYSCSNPRSVFQRKQQIYQAPRMGAEYRFEEGLRREKKPQNLFSNKERKGMENLGMISKQERTAPSTRITAMQADSLLTGKTRDTSLVIRADSTQTIPADTLLPPSTDTTARHLTPADVSRQRN